MQRVAQTGFLLQDRGMRRAHPHSFPGAGESKFNTLDVTIASQVDGTDQVTVGEIAVAPSGLN